MVSGAGWAAFGLLVAGVAGVTYLALKQPKVALSPTNVTQGQPINWSVTNFPPNSQIQAASGVAVQTATTDSTGAASGSLATTGQVPGQGYQVIVTVVNTGQFIIAYYNVIP